MDAATAPAAASTASAAPAGPLAPAPSAVEATTPAARGGSSARLAVADYLRLAKPRIVELLLVTTFPSMLLAASGWPGTVLLLGTLIGGAAVAGSAHTTNMLLERDIDARMARTASRPLPAGRVSAAGAARFAVVLLLAGGALLGAVAGPLALGLALAAWLHYVVVYTLWLKRRTPHNVVIGGLAGALPPLIGWAAVTGSLAVEAWLLFAVVFLWTPTHSWALAVARADDYSQAGVPMLPVLRGPRVAARHGLGYAAAAVGATLLLPAAGVGGWLLAAVLAALGAVLVTAAARHAAGPDPSTAWRLFHTSNGYLAAVFVAVAVAGVLGSRGG